MLQAEQVLQERYQLKRSLGHNAGRQTWLAEDLSIIDTVTRTPLVIVKLLAFSPQMQWDEFKLFEREAQVLKNLEHSRLPKYRDYFSLDRNAGQGLCWFGLVQDYIPGASLQQLLDQGRRFTEAQVRSIATQLLDILIYLHGLNPPVLHRDIKPSNLILGEDEQTYLVDFGAVQDPSFVEGATFTIVGTAGYAPLEQFWGKAVPASDLYAMGATLIHLLTGTAPADLPQNNLRIQFRERVSLNPYFVSWIESLTEPDLEERFSSAEQALAALKTGRSLTSTLNSRQPVSSRIQLKKSSTHLAIRISRPKAASTGIFKIFLKLVLAISSIIFLFLPMLIGFSSLALVFLGVLSNSIDISIFFIIIPLAIFFFWSWRKAQKELKKVVDDLNRDMLESLGIRSLFLTKENLSIDSHFFVLGTHAYQQCPITEIANIELDPLQGVIIQTKSERYVFGQRLTETEQSWLVQEIQEWLIANS